MKLEKRVYIVHITWGATPFSIPCTLLFLSANINMLTRSVICIHGIYWFPVPIGPPRPKKNGKYICFIMPPFLPNTTPDLIVTCLMLYSFGICAALSQSWLSSIKMTVILNTKIKHTYIQITKIKIKTLYLIENHMPRICCLLYTLCHLVYSKRPQIWSQKFQL